MSTNQGTHEEVVNRQKRVRDEEDGGLPVVTETATEPVEVAGGGELADKKPTVLQTRKSLKMPEAFQQQLGDFDDPDEAKDIEETVNGHIDYEDLPQARKDALAQGVHGLMERVGPGMTEQRKVMAVKQASKLKEFGGCARKSELIGAYRSLVRNGDIQSSSLVEELLLKKRGKSHSGVLVVTVFMGPGKFSCPKNCHYCPDQPGIARSYLLREPGVLRGFRNAWDPIRQFNDRASALENNGHVVDKIELIILGGTFSFYPKDYCREFMQASFYAANTYYDSAPFRDMKSLEEEIRMNETAKCRIIGITAETRPDYINKTELKRFRELGITRIQLGIQHLDDDILDIVNRECSTAKARVAIQKCLDGGFKVDAHWMPDLPGSSYEKDLEMFQYLLGPDNKDFQVDQWKVYPTMTVPFTKIKEWYDAGKYKPYAEEDNGNKMVELILYILQHCHHRIRLNRIVRDIPNNYIVGGENRPNLRQLLDTEMVKRGIVCNDIRDRECKGQSVNRNDAGIFVDEFPTDGGMEYYCSVENIDRRILYGHLRLRLRTAENMEENSSIFPALEGAALIRELHTYGKLVAVSGTNTGKETQHVGVGKDLMKKAEEIAALKGFTKVAIIAGVGVRGYYAKLGYTLEDTYMVKNLTPISTIVSPTIPLDGESTAATVGGQGAEKKSMMDRVKGFFGFGTA